MKNSSAGFLLSALFTGSIIIAGALIVYYAAPRPSMLKMKIDFQLKTHLLSI
jgi:hypothetical protein